MEATVDYKTWYAKVRFCRDHIVRDISVKKIKSDGKHFKPAALEDFSIQDHYAVKTDEFDPDGKERWYFAHVGRLAESIEALTGNTNRRISWPATCPRHCPREEDPPGTSQDEAAACVSTESISQQRARKVERTNKRKVAQEEAMRVFVNNSAVAFTTEEEMNKEMSHQSKTLLERMLDERDRRLERRIREIVEESVSSIVTKKLSKLEGMISTLSQSCTSSRDEGASNSGVLTSTPHKVPIGFGCNMDRGLHTSMMASTQDSDWATCLLIGVFGEEEAKLMRQYPRNENLKAFPRGFLSAAKELARKRMGGNNFSGDMEKIIERLPAFLSRRARDLSGQRNSSSGNSANTPKTRRKGSLAHLVDPPHPKVRKEQGEEELQERQTMAGSENISFAHLHNEWKDMENPMEENIQRPGTQNVEVQDREQCLRTNDASLGHAVAEAVRVVVNEEMAGSECAGSMTIL